MKRNLILLISALPFCGSDLAEALVLRFSVGVDIPAVVGDNF